MSLSFCCWQPVLTAHQAHTFKALRDKAEGRLIVVASRPEDMIRKAQGWTANDDRIIEPQLLPQRGWRRHIRELIDENPERIHIFGSPFERGKQSYALYRALKAGRRVYLLAEPFSRIGTGYFSDDQVWWSKLKALLRPAVYRLYAALLRRRVTGIFAISPVSVAQFTRIGFEPSRIHPFGYFVPATAAPAEPRADAALRCAYVGSFIARKGVGTLIRAMAAPEVKASGLTLDLFGPEAGAPATQGKIAYRGPIPFGEAQARITDFDLLVVPSLYDGWAVVVNEAILAGRPVLASEGVGAAAMLNRWRCGETFPPNDAKTLAARLASYAGSPEQVTEQARATAALAPLLEPKIAAGHMFACIAADLDGEPAPKAPWY